MVAGAESDWTAEYVEDDEVGRASPTTTTLADPSDVLKVAASASVAVPEMEAEVGGILI